MGRRLGEGVRIGSSSTPCPGKKSAPIFPTLSPHAILVSPSAPTDGRGPRSPGRREAVSSGGRGPHPRAGSSRSAHPGRRAGACPVAVDQGKGLRRESWNRFETHAANCAAGSCAGGVRSAVVAGPAGLPRLRRHRERRPDQSLPHPTNAGGRGRVRSPKGRTGRTAQGSRHASREGESRSAPGRRGCPSPVGRG